MVMMADPMFHAIHLVLVGCDPMTGCLVTLVRLDRMDE